MDFPPTSQLAFRVVSSASPTEHALPEIIWQKLQPRDVGMQPVCQHEVSSQQAHVTIGCRVDRKRVILSSWGSKRTYGQNKLFVRMSEAVFFQAANNLVLFAYFILLFILFQ